MAASVDEIPIDRKLDDIFEEAYNLYNGFDDCVEPTNSSEFQVCSKMPLFATTDESKSMTHPIMHNHTYLFSAKYQKMHWII